MATHSFKCSYFVKRKFDYLSLVVGIYPSLSFSLDCSVVVLPGSLSPHIFQHWKEFLKQEQTQPSWSLRTLRFLPQRVSPAAFPLHRGSSRGNPWEQGQGWELGLPWAVLGAQFGSTSQFPCSQTPSLLGLCKPHPALKTLSQKWTNSAAFPWQTQPHSWARQEGKVTLVWFWPPRSHGKLDLATWEVCESWRKDKKSSWENKMSWIEREVWKRIYSQAGSYSQEGEGGQVGIFGRGSPLPFQAGQEHPGLESPSLEVSEEQLEVALSAGTGWSWRAFPALNNSGILCSDSHSPTCCLQIIQAQRWAHSHGCPDGNQFLKIALIYCSCSCFRLPGSSILNLCSTGATLSLDLGQVLTGEKKGRGKKVKIF